MGNKVLYIDNVTTYDYVKNYRKNHDVDPSTSYFTYVVFTNYERPNNYGYSYHGDIFFDGKKITYINDIDVTKSVTDGKDNIIAYVNDDGRIGFVSSTIKLGGISNTYELFNVKTSSEISYEYISNLGYVTIEKPGEWGYEAFPDNNIEVTNNTISFGNDLTEMSYVKLWRKSTINNDTDKKEITTYAYCYIYNLSIPKLVTFGTTPTYFPVGTIYTPRMEIFPADAAQAELKFTADSNNIEIINTHTGTFKCVTPGPATITCSYNLNLTPPNSETLEINVNKINPHLSLSAYHTTYLWNDEHSEYNKTFCYAHYDVPEGVLNDEYTWLLNGENIDGSSSTKSGVIEYNNNLLRDEVNIVTFSLPEDKFYPNTAKIQLYAPTQEICRTQAITIDNVTQNNNVMTFHIVAYAASNNGYVDTNYVLNNSIGLTDFIITDIIKSGSYTYTYVTAQTEPSAINNLYIKSQMTYNDKPNTSNSQNVYYSYYTYNYISVQTSDSSFINAVKSHKTEIKFQHSDLVADPVVMSHDMYVSTQSI